jgi:hypothetical protein
MHTISATTKTAKQIRKGGCTKCLVAALNCAKSSMLLQELLTSFDAQHEQCKETKIRAGNATFASVERQGVLR